MIKSTKASTERAKASQSTLPFSTPFSSPPLSRVNVPLTQLSGASYAYLHVFLSKFMSSFLYPQTL